MVTVVSPELWRTSYRVVERYAWLPWRIAGQWRWRVPYLALEGKHLDFKPSPWITVARAMTHEPLAALVDAEETKAVVAYHARRAHA